MRIEFDAAVLPHDLDDLLAFDAQVFRKSDCFDAAYWRMCRSFWMVVEGARAGCCAFEEHADGQDRSQPQRGCLYVSTTGILPRYQGRGLGSIMKRWEIEYARRNEFARIVTNTRKSNMRMIDLNHKFGFTVVRITPDYYSRPREATVVMELTL